MDCRIKENPETTFDLVIQVKCQASENEDPVVLWKFPEDFGDQEVLQSIPKFCFPFDIARVTQVGQHFTFVLTDIESKQRFGFCRLTSGGKICLCILSLHHFYIRNRHEDPYQQSLETAWSSFSVQNVADQTNELKLKDYTLVRHLDIKMV